MNTNEIQEQARPPLRLWYRYKSFIEGTIYKTSRNEEEDIVYWRETLFATFITYLLPTCLIALIPGVYFGLKFGFVFIAVFDLFSAFSIAFVALNTSINLAIRKLFVVVILYCLAIVLFFYLGMAGPGIIYLLAIGIFIALIFSAAFAYWSIAANFIICVAFAVNIYYKLLPIPLTAEYNLGAWIAVSSNLLFLGTVSILLVNKAIKGLESMIQKEVLLKRVLKERNEEKIISSAQHKEAAEHYKSLFMLNPAPMWVLDGETQQFLQVNEAAVQTYGYSSDEFLSMNIMDIKMESDFPVMIADLQKNIDLGSPLAIYTQHRRKNNEIFPVEVVFNTIPFRGKMGTLVISQDVTEQRESQNRIATANRLYAFNSAINQTIVHVTDEKALFSETCRIAIEVGQFKMAWIGAVDIVNKKINLVESSGLPEEDKHLFTNVIYDNGGLQDKVMQSGSYYVCNDIENELESGNWKLYASKRGIRSCIVLPIKKSGIITGTFNLYSTQKNFFVEHEVLLLLEVVGDISFGLNIFEKEKHRKLIEAKIVHSELRLKMAQAIAQIGSWELIFSTGVATWSDEACRIYEMSDLECVHSYESWLGLMHPDDMKYVMHIMEESRNSLSSTAFYHRILLPDGTVKHIHSQTKYEFDSLGQLVGLYGVVHDVTGRKEVEDALAKSEENLRRILNLLPQAIYVKTINGDFVFKNERFSSRFNTIKGDIKNSAISETPGIDIIFSDDREVILSGKTKINPELVVTDVNGNLQFFYTTKVPYSTAGKNEKAVLGIVTEITKSKLAENEKSKMVADLLQHNNDLQQFSYIVSHNLRAPVANIIGLSDILKMPDTEWEQARKLIGHLSATVNNLDTIVKDLNDILQVKHHANEYNETIYFTKIVDDIKFTIGALCEKEDIHILTHFSAVEHMSAVKSYIHSIFYNLIINSIKYKREKVATYIEITSGISDGKIWLTFKDNGIGIDLTKKSNQVFGLYKRFHTHVEGKGMGLFMVKTQVNSMNGSINVTSEVDKGTEFRIEFEQAEKTI